MISGSNSDERSFVNGLLKEVLKLQLIAFCPFWKEVGQLRGSGMVRKAQGHVCLADRAAAKGYG